MAHSDVEISPEDKVLYILDNCMRMGAALGSFSSRFTEKWNVDNFAVDAAFKAAQVIYANEIKSIMRSQEIKKEKQASV